MERKHLLKESFIATMIIIIISWLISMIPLSREYFKVFHQGLADFDLYDLDYSRLHNKNLKHEEKDPSTGNIYEKDAKIVLVELGDNRTEIASQINLLSKYEPKVIALDVILNHANTNIYDSLGDVNMGNALKGKSNIVFGFNLSEGNRIMPNHFQPDCTAANTGFFNFYGEENSVIRSYAPTVKINEVPYKSFSSAIMRMFDPKYDTTSEIDNYQRQIHYTGNSNNYITINKSALVDYDSSGQLGSIIKDKIVLIGFFVQQDENGRPPLIMEDLHFTPLNRIASGKSFPDMYGVVIHANILSMIINNNYIRLAPMSISYLFAFGFTFGFIYFLIYQYSRNRHYWHIAYMLIQVLIIIAILYLFLLLFGYWDIKIRLQPIMIAMVLSLEVFGVYKLLATWLNKKFNYKTIFKH